VDRCSWFTLCSETCDCFLFVDFHLLCEPSDPQFVTFLFGFTQSSQQAKLIAIYETGRFGVWRSTEMIARVDPSMECFIAVETGPPVRRRRKTHTATSLSISRAISVRLIFPSPRLAHGSPAIAIAQCRRMMA
jgi:hypothetical protein